MDHHRPDRDRDNPFRAGNDPAPLVNQQDGEA
jgi:hypothetical protein